MEKMHVSKEWTPAERTMLREAISQAVTELPDEAQLRKHLLYEAPVFAETRRNKQHFERLLHFLDTTGPLFLEANRHNYRQFIA